MENHHYENEGQFQRKMTSRHLLMLSLGGVIGTGLFLSSGYTICTSWSFGGSFVLPYRGYCRLFGYVVTRGVGCCHASDRLFSYLCNKIH